MLNKTNFRWFLQAALVLCLFTHNAHGASNSSSSSTSTSNSENNEEMLEEKLLQTLIQEATGLPQVLTPIVQEYAFQPGLQRRRVVTPEGLSFHNIFNLGNNIILLTTADRGIVLALSANDTNPWLDIKSLSSLANNQVLKFPSGGAIEILGCAQLNSGDWVLSLNNNHFMVFSYKLPSKKLALSKQHIVLDVEIKAIFRIHAPNNRTPLGIGGCKVFKEGPYAGCLVIPAVNALEIYNVTPRSDWHQRQPAIPLEPGDTIEYYASQHLVPLKHDNFLLEHDGEFTIMDNRGAVITGMSTQSISPASNTQKLSAFTLDHEDNILFASHPKYGSKNSLRQWTLNGNEKMTIPIEDYSVSQLLMLRDNTCLLLGDQLSIYDLTNHTKVESAEWPWFFGPPIIHPNSALQLEDGSIAVIVPSGEVNLYTGSLAYNKKRFEEQAKLPIELQKLYANLLQLSLRKPTG